jgi:hypothetical protein
MQSRLPAVIRHHEIEEIGDALEGACADDPPAVVLDGLAELKHLREQLRRVQDLATRERDRRMEAEREREAAVAERDLIRRAWVTAAATSAPPAGAFWPYPDATG